MKLSDRLAKIADIIPDGARVADIGTDHGYLPIFLAESGKARHVILTDVNRGPLEKARMNIAAFGKGDSLRALEKPRSLMPSVQEDRSLRGRIQAKLTGETQYAVLEEEREWDLRLGSGLGPLENGEVDVAVIAGMGGYLIREILEEDPEKTASVKLFILQPRTEEGMLRNWLRETGWGFYKDVLVREGTFLCQIIAVVPPAFAAFAETESDRLKRLCGVLSWQVSPFWFTEKDPLVKEYLERMLVKKEGILNAVRLAKTDASDLKTRLVETETAAIRELLSCL